MKKNRRYKKQPPLWKNAALLLLALVLLGGTFALYAYLSQNHVLNLQSLQNFGRSLLSNEEKLLIAPEPTENQKPSAKAHVFSFYKYLMPRNSSEPQVINYTIQVALFKDKDEAEAFSRELKDRCGLTFMVDRKGRLSSIQWGTYTTMEKARQECARLSDKLHRTCTVVPL